MTYDGSVRVPMEELSPDGRVVILPRVMWADQTQAVVDGELDGDRAEAADLLAWEVEQYAVGPTAYSSPVADCPDCRRYEPCGLHRCRAVRRSNGERCKLRAEESSGFMFCQSHACSKELANGVYCAEQRTVVSSYCVRHGGKSSPRPEIGPAAPAPAPNHRQRVTGEVRRRRPGNPSTSTG